MAAELTQADVEAKIAALGDITEEQRNEIVCALIGHSRIQDYCFGYYTCGRCGTQVGDTLASTYAGAETAVVIGHRCSVCEANYATCTWRDTLYAPDPFTVEPESEACDARR